MAYVGFLDSCPICWQTKLHSVTLITLATNHSEYCAAAKAGREAKWLEKLFVFLESANLGRRSPELKPHTEKNLSLPVTKPEFVLRDVYAVLARDESHSQKRNPSFMNQLFKHS
jgi:hypothetical protein